MKIRIQSRLLSICAILFLTSSGTWSLLTPESTGEKKEAKVVPAAQDTEDSRKLVSEATPYPDPKLTDPTQGTDMNKIDVKNSDEYSKMDLIVNDIKQVIRFSVCVEWEGQASSFF